MQKIYLLLVFIFSIGSLCAQSKVDEIKVIKEQIESLYQSNDSLMNDNKQLASKYDSLNIHFSNLSKTINEYKIRESYFSDIISGVVNWFSVLITIVIAAIGLYSWNNYTKSKKYIDNELNKIEESNEIQKKAMHHLKMQLLSISIRVLERDISNYSLFIDAINRRWNEDVNGWVNTLIFHIIFISDRILSAAEFGDESISQGSINEFVIDVHDTTRLIQEIQDRVTVFPKSFIHEIESIKQRAYIFENISLNNKITQLIATIYPIEERLNH